MGEKGWGLKVEARRGEDPRERTSDDLCKEHRTSLVVKGTGDSET